MIQTLAFAQNPEETEIAPPPHAVSELAESNGNVVELERATPAGRNSEIQALGLANCGRQTEIPLPHLALSVAAGAIQNSPAIQRVTDPLENSMIQTLGLAPNRQETEIEPSPRILSQAEALENSAQSERVRPTPENSTVQTLDLALAPRQAEVAPPPPVASGVAVAIEKSAHSERVITPAAQNATIQTFDLAPPPKQAETEPRPQAVSEVAEGIQNTTELERIPADEVSLEPLSRIVFHTDPRGLASDRFRFLRMRLRELSDARKLQSLLVTSPLSLDGKSTVSLNLATALADRRGNAVLLLEADLYHPTLAQRLGLKSGPGLAECLQSGSAPLSVIRRMAPLGWYFLPAGSQLTNPSDLLHGDGFATIMKALSPHFKWIVIDSPPVIPVADALVLARQADASLLVVRAGQTPIDAVEAAIESLGAKHVMGVILNGVEGLERLYSKYNKYYGSAAAPTTA
jgi:capsular exopolysaccharide synthesis family protein